MADGHVTQLDCDHRSVIASLDVAWTGHNHAHLYYHRHITNAMRPITDDRLHMMDLSHQHIRL